MFLLLEDNKILYMGNVVSLVRKGVVTAQAEKTRNGEDITAACGSQVNPRTSDCGAFDNSDRHRTDKTVMRSAELCAKEGSSGQRETVIFMSDSSVQVTCFTPQTLRSKSEKFWEEATLRKEQLITCKKNRSKKTG